jgi:hypothetical protein
MLERVVWVRYLCNLATFKHEQAGCICLFVVDTAPLSSDAALAMGFQTQLYGQRSAAFPGVWALCCQCCCLFGTNQYFYVCSIPIDASAVHAVVCDSSCRHNHHRHYCAERPVLITLKVRGCIDRNTPQSHRVDRGSVPRALELRAARSLVMKCPGWAVLEC